MVPLNPTLRTDPSALSGGSFNWRLLLFGAAYFLSAVIGELLRFRPHPFVSIWLPGGMVLAMLLMHETRRWPAILAAMVAGSVAFDILTGRSAWLMFLFALANGAEALCGAWLVRRFVTAFPQLRTLRELIGVFLLAGVVGTALGALIVAFGIRWPAKVSFTFSTSYLWCGSVLIGVFLMLPLVLAWRRGLQHVAGVVWSAPRTLEAAVLASGLCLSAYFGFRHFWVQQMPFEYLPVPFILWAAFRFGIRGTTLANMLVCCLAAWFATQEYASLGKTALSPALSVIKLQMMLALVVFVGLVPAVLLASLRAGEAKYRAIVTSVSDVITVVAPDGTIVYKSPNIERAFGWKPEELVGKPCSVTMHQDDLERVMAAFRDLVATPGGTVELRYRYRCRNGEYRHIELSAVNRLDDPDLRGVLANYRDITKLVENEESLGRERVFTNAVLDSVPGLLYLYDDQGRLVRWNRQHTKLTGYTDEELSRMTLADWYRGNDADCAKVLKAVQHCLIEGYAEEEANLRRKDGTTALFHFTAVHLEIGGRHYFAGIGIDISASRRTEEALRQAQKMDAVGKLAGGVAHDFNNILASMMMHLSLLLEDETLPRAVRESLGELRSDSHRAADLTRQLLLFGRRQAMQMRAVDLNESVGNLLKMLCRLIGEHIRIESTHAAGPLWIRADSGMVDQVIVNLCVNARDAMPRGGLLSIATESVVVGGEEARLHPEARPGTFACLLITDTGHGVPEEARRHLFEPFFTTKEVGKGTGLGLATVHGIAKQHGGWITLEWTGEHGTCFRVYFPLSGEPGAAPAARLGQPAQPLAVRGGSETILLVEDADSVRKVVSKRLRGLGYRVFEAASAREALRCGEELGDAVDLLFTDVVMPEGMSGIELARHFRKTRPRVRVVISSGYSQELTDGQGLDAAAEGVAYLPKPYTLEALSETIRGCLDGGGGGGRRDA